MCLSVVRSACQSLPEVLKPPLHVHDGRIQFALKRPRSVAVGIPQRGFQKVGELFGLRQHQVRLFTGHHVDTLSRLQHEIHFRARSTQMGYLQESQCMGVAPRAATNLAKKGCALRGTSLDDASVHQHRCYFSSGGSQRKASLSKRPSMRSPGFVPNFVIVR